MQKFIIANDTLKSRFIATCNFYDPQHVSYIRSTSDLVDFSSILTVFILIWNILLPIFTILGNSIVILTVLLKFQLRRVPSNILMCSLALSDLITGAVLQTNNAWGIYDILRGRITCNVIYPKVVETVGIVTIIASLANLAIITLDRYIAIVHALRYSAIVTFRRTVQVLAVVWSFSLVFGVSLSVLASPYKDVYNALRMVFYTYMIAIYVCMVVLYIRLYLISRAHEQKITHQTGFQMKSERRGLATVSMVMLALVICFIPYTVVRSIMRVRRVQSQMLNIARVISFTFMLCNAMVNPLVYFFRSRNLRSYSHKMLLSALKKIKEKCTCNCN